MKLATVALSKPVSYGCVVFATLHDRTGKDRYHVFSPLHRKYWKKKEQWEAAIQGVSANLRSQGYSVQSVSIEEYMHVSKQHIEQE